MIDLRREKLRHFDGGDEGGESARDRHMRGGAPHTVCAIGGSSSSSSRHYSETHDRRNVSGENSVAVSGDGNSIMVTDGRAFELATGAVAASGELAQSALAGVVTSVHELRSTNEHALNAIRSSSESAVGAVKDAYSESRTGNEKTTTMLIAALAAAGMLFVVVKGRKG